MARKASAIEVSRHDFEKVIEVDPDPDLSYLGEFMDSTPVGQWYVDRVDGTLIDPEGDVIRSGLARRQFPREYLYFVPTNQPTHEKADWGHVSEADKRKVKREHGSLYGASVAYMIQDYERMEEYMHEDRVQYLLSAKVEIPVQLADGTTSRQTVRSSTVGGIEADSEDDDYLEDTYQELAGELVDILHAMHITVTDD